MKKILLSSFILFLFLFGIPNVNAETGYYNWNGTFTTNQGTHSAVTFSSAGITFLGVQSSDSYMYYMNFNVTNQFHSDIDTIGFYIYNNMVHYGTRSGYAETGNASGNYEIIDQGEQYLGDFNYTYQYPDGVVGTNMIPPLVRLNSSTCSVQPVGTTTTGDNWSYAEYFWVECNIKDNKEVNTISMRWVENTNVSTARVGIQTSFVYWSNTDTQKQIQSEIKDLNENITSSDTSKSENQASGFFENFESDDYGLSDIITMPLSLINTLTSSACVELTLTLPFVNKTFNLPCMSTIYSKYFGNFFTLYQTVTFGFVAYWVIVKIFALVKGFKDPDDDKVEVMDL